MRETNSETTGTEPYARLLLQALQQNELLGQMDAAVQAELQARMEFLWVQSGDNIFTQGAASDSLAIVVLGRVVVIQQGEEGVSRRLLELGHGQTIGETGIITGEPRSADVIATRDSLLATLSREAYDALAAAYPQQMHQYFVTPTIRRLQQQLAGATRINAAVITMALIPLQEQSRFPEFTQRLAESMQKAGTTVVLDADFIQQHFGEIPTAGSPQAERLTQWLGEQEAAHELVIYVADRSATDWSRRCLRQADKLVLVGETAVSPTPPPTPVPILDLPESNNIDRYLLLLHSDETSQPQGTAAWLEAYAVRHHYHVRLGKDEEMDRAARLLAERGIGLVLGGASARGFVHIGVLRALREAGVPVDLLGGASSGAASAVGMARPWDDETLIRKAGRGPKLQYTLPFSAFTTGFGVSKWLEEMFGDLQLEDCWSPIFFPVYNLARNKLVIYERGPAAKLIRAATALPVVFPPLIEDTDILIDAGVVNFLPADLMQQRPDIKTIIAVNIVTFEAKSSKRQYAYDGRISGWTILWQKINPFAGKLRYLPALDILWQSLLIGGVERQRETRVIADYQIRLVLSDFGAFDFSRMQELVQFGREHTAAQINSSGLIDLRPD